MQTLSLTDCLLEDNVASNHGGAIRLQGNARVTLDNCTFRNNRAPRDGAISNSRSISVSFVGEASHFTGNNPAQRCPVGQYITGFSFSSPNTVPQCTACSAGRFGEEAGIAGVSRAHILFSRKDHLSTSILPLNLPWMGLNSFARIARLERTALCPGEPPWTSAMALAPPENMAVPRVSAQICSASDANWANTVIIRVLPSSLSAQAAAVKGSTVRARVSPPNRSAGGGVLPANSVMLLGFSLILSAQVDALWESSAAQMA